MKILVDFQICINVPLKTGTTFAVLSTEGKKTAMKERLNTFANSFKISFFRSNDIL